MTISCPLCKGDVEEVSLLNEMEPHAEAMDGFECLNSECETQFVIWSSKVEKP